MCVQLINFCCLTDNCKKSFDGYVFNTSAIYTVKYCSRNKNAFNIEMHSTNFKHISSLLKKHSQEYALLTLPSS